MLIKTHTHTSLCPVMSIAFNAVVSEISFNNVIQQYTSLALLSMCSGLAVSVIIRSSIFTESGYF